MILKMRFNSASLVLWIGLAFVFATEVQGQLVFEPLDYCIDEKLSVEHKLTDLYCINIQAVPGIRGLSGYAKMVPVENLYGVAVTRDGHHAYNLEFFMDGLPDLDAHYVAWATTPFLHPTVKLGTLRNGKVTLGPVDFNKFIVLITEEGSEAVEARKGKLIARGASPSNKMEAHDLGQTAPLALTLPQIEPDNQAEAHHGGHHGMHASSDWEMPPMHPAIEGVPGMHGIRPQVAPFDLKMNVDGLPEARPNEKVRLEDGATYVLNTGYVQREIAGQTLPMYGFNEQYPGPLLDVTQDSEITVDFRNHLAYPTAIHWHGLRLDYRYDGVPGMTQDLVQQEASFEYKLKFPDPGIYWFHPHHREDTQMDLGLYANILVRSDDPDYFNPVHREEFLMLDDVLLDDAGVVPFGKESANYMMMGRFGNTFLINGSSEYQLEVQQGEVIRFFVTNSSNTRTYNISLPNHTMKLIGSDLGKFEQEQMVENLVIAPAERYIVEVQFKEIGQLPIENRVQAIDHRYGAFFPEVDTLGIFDVVEAIEADQIQASFPTLRENQDVVADIDQYREQFERPVDYELTARLEVDSLPAVVQQMMRFDAVYFNPVEWSGTMPMMNWATTGREVRWILEDEETGAQNMDIHWRFKVGDVVKIRMVNERDAFHAMQHPIHIHGQRFLVLSRDGVLNNNLVWKDTTILPAGTTADILLELSNPGKWMVHCHIAEHIDSGMMFTFEVEN